MITNRRYAIPRPEVVRGGILDAIAIASVIRDLPAESYARHFAGGCPNPVGGAEAVLSHLVVRRLGLPAAHAPLVNFKELDLEDRVVDPRGAAELVSASGLACVLMGLHRAPRLASGRRSGITGVFGRDNLLAVVAPASCLGGIPVLYGHRAGVPIIAVRSNETVLEVTAAALELPGVIEVASYAEAAGVILALREGISLESIHRPLPALRP